MIPPHPLVTHTYTDIDDFLSSTSDDFVVGQQAGHGHGE